MPCSLALLPSSLRLLHYHTASNFWKHRTISMGISNSSCEYHLTLGRSCVHAYVLVINAFVCGYIYRYTCAVVYFVLS